MRIETASKNDFPELMEMLYQSFGTLTANPIRFESLFPDLYQPEDDSMRHIRLIRADGKIVSSLGIFPIELKSGKYRFSVPGIGGVATLPEFRGRGLMSELLDATAKEIQNSGAPFSWLAGARYRYGHWNWERGGAALVLSLTHQSSRRLNGNGHKIEEVSAAEMHPGKFAEARNFSKFGGNCSDDEFKLKCQRLNLKTFTASGPSGIRAYCTIKTQTKRVIDFGGFPEAVSSLFRAVLPETQGLSVQLPVTGEYLHLLRPAAENWHTVSTGNYMVANLPECLKLINQVPENPHKSVNLKISGSEKLPPQQAWLGTGNGQIEIDKKLHREAPALELNPMQAARMLFGPFKPSHELGKPEFSWLDQLLPLPVFIPELYHV